MYYTLQPYICLLLKSSLKIVWLYFLKQPSKWISNIYFVDMNLISAELIVFYLCWVCVWFICVSWLRATNLLDINCWYQLDVNCHQLFLFENVDINMHIKVISTISSGIVFILIRSTRLIYRIGKEIKEWEVP